MASTTVFNNSAESEGDQNVIDASINTTLSVQFRGYKNTGGAIELTEEILDSLILSHELVFILVISQLGFCSFDLPIFDEVANIVKAEFPQEGKIAFGRAICWDQPSISNRFDIGVYSGFRLIRDGQIEKRCYKGDETVKTIVEYLHKELEDPVIEFKDINDLGALDSKKRTYIGYFDRKDVPEYDIFRRAASQFKFYCQFYVGFGGIVDHMHPAGQPIIVMRPEVTLSNEHDETFTGSLLSYDQVYEWMCTNYVPVVRKTPITWENQYDFIVEHLPMLVLFHKTGDEDSVKKFSDFCNSAFSHLNNKLLILTSDDEKLYRDHFLYIKKNVPDPPFITYRRTDWNTYLYGGLEDMDAPGKLEQFVNERVFNKPVDSGDAVNVTEVQLNSMITSNEVVFIMFSLNFEYPEIYHNIHTFNDAAKKIKEEFPQVGRVALVKVDCSREESLIKRFNIERSYEFKLIRIGREEKRDYKDEVTVEALVQYIRKELEDPIVEFQDISNLGTLDPMKRMYIGYFDSKDDPEYDIFRQAASNFKYYCHFCARFGYKMHPQGYPAIIVMRPEVTLSNEHDETFNGSLLNYDEVHEWMLRNYVPVVRKVPISCENRDDFLREKLPLVILLHKPEDEESVKKYKDFCEANFMDLKNKILFLTACDEKYRENKLRRYRKKESDLPLIVYEGNYILHDYNGYLFGGLQNMEIPGTFKQFVTDHIANKPTDDGEAPNVTESTIDLVIESNEIVMIMFYLESLYPIIFEIIPAFNNAAKKIKEEFPAPGQVALVKVECHREQSLQKRFVIYSFPSFVLIHNGQQIKKPLSGNLPDIRLVEYVKKELQDPIVEFKDINDLGTLDPKKKLCIGYFDHRDVPEYGVFKRVARVYKNNCQFRVGFGEIVAKMHPSGQPVVVLRPDITLSNEQDKVFTGSLLSYDEIREWMYEQDVPLVRKTPISCENEDYLLAETLPLLVLFHKPENVELVKQYINVCELSCQHFRNRVIFLTSDDDKYALKVKKVIEEKQSPEVPFIGLICEDRTSVYIFDNIKDIEVPGKLEKFIDNNVVCGICGLFD